MVTEILTNFLLRMTQSGISIRLLVRFTKIISENYFIGILRGSEETEIPWQVVWMEEGAKLFMKDCVKWLPNEWVQIQQGKEAGCCLTGFLLGSWHLLSERNSRIEKKWGDGCFPSDACKDREEIEEKEKSQEKLLNPLSGQARGRGRDGFQGWGWGWGWGLRPFQKYQSCRQEGYWGKERPLLTNGQKG